MNIFMRSPLSRGLHLCILHFANNLGPIYFAIVIDGRSTSVFSCK